MSSFITFQLRSLFQFSVHELVNVMEKDFDKIEAVYVREKNLYVLTKSG